MNGPHDLDAVVDVVGDADVLDVVVAWVEVAPLTEVDVEVVERDGRVSPATTSHTATAPLRFPEEVEPADGHPQPQHDDDEGEGAADDGVDGGVEVGDVRPDLLPLRLGGEVSPLCGQAGPDAELDDALTAGVEELAGLRL